jgi:hypothetical protein
MPARTVPPAAGWTPAQKERTPMLPDTAAAKVTAAHLMSLREPAVWQTPDVVGAGR